jgi:hypothetical protein
MKKVDAPEIMEAYLGNFDRAFHFTGDKLKRLYLDQGRPSR